MGVAVTQAVVISAGQLMARVRDGAETVVLEVGRDSDAEYLEGHVPGAHAVVLGRDLFGRRTDASGNGPLPDPAELQERLRGWGVDHDSTVVVYSRENPAVATRAWWTLRWAGVTGAHYLEGGLQAWEEIGGALDTVVPTPGEGSVVVRAGSLPVLSPEEAARIAVSGHLLDARGTAAYLGDPQLPRVGHIPGAHSVPGSGNFADGRLLEAESLRDLYSAYLDGREIGAYCGSGVSATTTVLALAQLGIEVALFPGSWSQWITDPSRPSTTGDRPGVYPS
ncbi:thiosulfate/3-mercaptopyruvate sulfurtransferase [Kribbella aluminosa]|uniref:thiosulfate sulfurtransferase n=1 Tax=Kribbella aluminosa TaxID=416017 RepID=A0ABS4UJB9_9ACTN|nr:rhodanese-like domain-containing protein [Kribbella aluminosa]MBP2351690.1 thiosulfate/3-mercaptopyruvate sulfurtransferase [Kribbella aluminosa]